ncbi:MAG: hypothetical protein FWH55_02120 [Oscillospiraceae bacterium]|nr:hypothetical protein [Oscillospiraceae bacterium]
MFALKCVFRSHTTSNRITSDQWFAWYPTGESDGIRPLNPITSGQCPHYPGKARYLISKGITVASGSQ